MKKIAWTLAIGWSIFVLGLMLFPGNKIPYWIGKYDKEAHFLFYFVLAFLWALAISLTWKWGFLAAIPLPWSISTAHAWATEWLQGAFVAQNRTSDMADFLAGRDGSTWGVGVFLTIWLIIGVPRTLRWIIQGHRRLFRPTPALASP